LRGHLAEGPRIIQKVDSLSESIQANDSFHAVKKKYTDKGLNFTTSTETHFVLGILSKFRNSGWQNQLRESLDISPRPAECNKMPMDLESKRQRKNEKRRRKNETRNESRARTGRDRKGEGDSELQEIARSRPKLDPIKTIPHLIKDKT
jgi:hypothetical protein